MYIITKLMSKFKEFTIYSFSEFDPLNKDRMKCK